MTAGLLFAPASLAGDEQNFQLNAKIENLFDGDMNAYYDQLAGVELQYFFLKQERWSHFATLGHSQDLGENENFEASSLNLYHLEIGSRYEFASLWNKPVYGQLSLGIERSEEEFETELIDRTAKDEFIENNVKASLGFGIEVTNRFNTELFVNQRSDEGSSVGLGLAVKF